MGHIQKQEQSKLADQRISKMSFGDKVTNVCAGEKNPNRLAYFVRKNRHNIECTDKNGAFWFTDKTVIFADWIDYKESTLLYDPIWRAEFT